MAPTWPAVAVTGHRPKDFTPAQADWVRDELSRVFAKLRDEHGMTILIDGMAQGVDTWAAQAALELGLELHSYVPFPQQADEWPDEDRAEWARLRAAASIDRLLFTEYSKGAFFARNNAMVEACDAVVAVLMPGREQSGTGHCVRAARSARKPIVMLNAAARDTRVTGLAAAREEVAE